MAVEPNIPIKDVKVESAVLKQVQQAVREAGNQVQQTKEALKQPKQEKAENKSPEEKLDTAGGEGEGGSKQAQAVKDRGASVDIKT